jgi:hypothetical protein
MGKTVLFGILTGERERKMEKRNEVAIPSVLADEVEDGEKR